LLFQEKIKLKKNLLAKKRNTRKNNKFKKKLVIKSPFLSKL